jgi:hypothetical protein
MMILFTAVCIIAACNKSDSDIHELPVTSPLYVAAAKAGDSIRIKGSNFTTDLNQIEVSFNGVKGAVVRSTVTEIVVVVPAGAKTGNVIVTVFGNAVSAGSLTVMPLTLYCIKSTYVSPNSSYQLVSLDPATLNETVVFNLNDIYNGFYMNDLVYLPTTNEVLGLKADTLVKINVETKKTTLLRLSTGSQFFDGLVLDNANNLYTRKAVNGGPNTINFKLAKIDAATGTVTDLNPWTSANNMIYFPSTNEIWGISNDQELVKYNLTTQNTSSVQLPNNTHFYSLIKDNNSNLYWKNSEHIAKVDPVTLAETEVLLNTDWSYPNQYTYIPQRNELAGFRNSSSFFRYSLDQKTSSTTKLSDDLWTRYESLITN